MPEDFATRARRLMDERGESVRGLAKLVPCDPGHVSKLINGRRCPSPEMAARVDEALGAGGELADLPAAPRERYHRLDVEVDEPPVAGDYLDETRRTIARLVALDGTHGGAEVAPLALRSFRRARHILDEGRYAPTIERDLEAVTAELGELSGWLLFDAERHDEARAVNLEALALARIAGDTSMELFILANQALASVHTGRHREALRIARCVSPRGGLPGRVRALFDVRTARALASLGDENAALDAFDRARSSFADGTTSRDPVWSWWFDERELAGHEGMVHASLGDHERALPQLAAAVERSEGREHFRWALYIHRANLLRACLRAGSWSEAERVARDVAPMVGQVASARTEGILRVTVGRPRRRGELPPTLADVLDTIAHRLASSA